VSNRWRAWLCETATVTTPEPLDAPQTAPWAPPVAVPPPPPTPHASLTGAGPSPAFVPQAVTSGPVRSSRALATACLTLYWCRTGAEALQALAFANRRSVINTAIAHSAAGGITRSDVDADDRARALIVTVSILLVALTLAAAIATSLWARRVAENARSKGDRVVRPGLATGGWYIPIGWFWVGFNQIKNAVTRTGQSPRLIGRWQTAFVLATVLSSLILRSSDTGDTLQGLRNATTTGLVASVISLGLFAWCTIAARKALRSTTDALG